MNNFTKSLRFKVTLLVITVELLILSGVGVFYTHRFNQEIDNAIIARLSIPGLLMTRGELSFDVVSDKRTMEGLLREPYSEGIVIGLDGHVYFSSNPARLDTHLDEIDGLRLPGPESSTISVDAPDLITPFQDSTGTYLTCLSPLRPDGKFTGYLYLKVGTGTSEAEKRNIFILFAIGTLGTIALTALILSWLLDLMVTKRLNYLVEIFRRFARGDYATRAQPSGGDDEIATLGQNFNSMMEAIQERENDLRRLTLLQRTILDNVAYGIISTTPDGIVTSFNPAAERLVGYASDDVVGKQTPALWHDLEEIARHARLLSKELGETVAPGFEVFAARPRRTLPEEGEWTFIRKDGRRIPVNLSVTALRDESGQITGFVGLTYDLSERKQAGEALRESEQRYRLVFENSPVSIWEEDFSGVKAVFDDLRKKGVTDIENYFTQHPEIVRQCAELAKIINVNRAALTLHAAANKEELLAGLVNTFTPESFDTFRQELVCLWNGVTEMTRDAVVKTLAGVPRNVTVYYSVCPGYEETLSKVLVSLADITERKRAEKEIRQLNAELEQRVQDRTRELAASEERMRLFFERQLVGMAITSPEKGWVQVNDKICEMLGYSREELLRLSWAEMTYPEDLVADVTQFERLLRGEIDNYMLEKRFIRKDGSIVFTNLAVGCVRRADRSVDYVLALLEDITERKHAEENIRELNAELQQRAKALEDANKELESFSYSVSHDLRTPLRAIDGFSHILLEDYAGKLDAEGKRLLGVVRENTQRMGQLIDDILKFSRTGRLEMSLSEIDMEKMAREVVTELQPSVAGSPLQVEIEHLPPVAGDSAMLRQVFVNLLSNAIKFSRTREVPKIQVGATAEDGETIYFVKDNGAGFDMQYADKLFGVFRRLHSEKEFEGTGIGLAIVKRIITRHGGRVWAEGKVNEGATIYFALPITAAGHG